MPLAVLLAALLAVPGLATARGGPELDARVVHTGQVKDDLYAAGRAVDISATAAGDVVAAGGNVQLTGETAGNVIVAGGNVEVGRRVGGDVLAAGGNVEISGRVADDVRAAGGTVLVAATVTGDLVAAGGDVILDSGGRVGGRAWLAGGDVSVAGSVAGELRSRAETVHLTGTVEGDAELAGETVRIGPQARIGGKLRYASPREAEIADGARIAGGVERLPWHEAAVPGGVAWAGVTFGIIGVLVTLFLTATIVRFALPGFSLGAAETLATHPWKSLALGFALLVCVPVATALGFSLVITAPLAGALLLTYPIALALAWIVVAVLLAEALQRWFYGRAALPIGWRVLLLWASVLLLGVVGVIPALGQVVLFVALLLGLGAVGLHLAARYAAGGAAPGRR